LTDFAGRHSNSDGFWWSNCKYWTLFRFVAFISMFKSLNGHLNLFEL